MLKIKTYKQSSFLCLFTNFQVTISDACCFSKDSKLVGGSKDISNLSLESVNVLLLNYYSIIYNIIVMGKEQQTNNQGNGDKKEQQKQYQKKKIIKKILFKTKEIGKQADELKDWKPVKIQRKTQPGKSDSMKQQNIAQSFLSALSKPVNKTVQKNSFYFDQDDPIKLAPKPAMNVKKLTPQQIKWDIEDQTYIQKQFIPEKKIQHKFEENPNQNIEQQQNEPNIVIDVKGSSNNTTKMRHIDISKIIDNNWKEAAHRKIAQNELWDGSQGLLEGHGNLSKLAKDAQQKAEQIEQEMNKRQYERKQMKNRYGW